jgi:transposase
MGHRHELSDAAWALLAPLLPPRETKGRYYRDHRTILNGMLWILATGAPWRDLPERYGPWETVYSRFARWQRTGLWARIVAALREHADQAGHVDWELWYLDGSTVRAHRHAAGGGKKPARGAAAQRARGSRSGTQPRRLRHQTASGR